MHAFHHELPRLLREGGLYSFFNGMCPFNLFFQGVACQVRRGVNAWAWCGMRVPLQPLLAGGRLPGVGRPRGLVLRFSAA